MGDAAASDLGTTFRAMIGSRATEAPRLVRLIAVCAGVRTGLAATALTGVPRDGVLAAVMTLRHLTH